ncbi:hypothetical protein GX51_04881 [Blastomyces parvus]|uniref:Uncharacterized protein n=1 Tax=Blastomyces parvus TaxID=2060905 RepID=A0A2B7WZM9_9EURO|nr:hypothetical protein GX51_04881 [Blastomyces parvus]
MRARAASRRGCHSTGARERANLGMDNAYLLRYVGTSSYRGSRNKSKMNMSKRAKQIKWTSQSRPLIIQRRCRGLLVVVVVVVEEGRYGLRTRAG